MPAANPGADDDQRRRLGRRIDVPRLAATYPRRPARRRRTSARRQAGEIQRGEPAREAGDATDQRERADAAKPGARPARVPGSLPLDPIARPPSAATTMPRTDGRSRSAKGVSRNAAVRQPPVRTPALAARTKTDHPTPPSGRSLSAPSGRECHRGRALITCRRSPSRRPPRCATSSAYASEKRVTELNWRWIALMLTAPPVAGWLVALPFWRKSEMILGNLPARS